MLHQIPCQQIRTGISPYPHLHPPHRKINRISSPLLDFERVIFPPVHPLKMTTRLDPDLPNTTAAPNLPRHTSRRKTHLYKFVRHNVPRLRPGTDKRTAARGRPIPYPTLSYLVPGAPSCLAGRCAQGLRPGSSEIFRARSQAPLSRPEILSSTALRVALRGLMPGMLRLSGTR